MLSPPYIIKLAARVSPGSFNYTDYFIFVKFLVIKKFLGFYFVYERYSATWSYIARHAFGAIPVTQI